MRGTRSKRARKSTIRKWQMVPWSTRLLALPWQPEEEGRGGRWGGMGEGSVKRSLGAESFVVDEKIKERKKKVRCWKAFKRAKNKRIYNEPAVLCWPPLATAGRGILPAKNAFVFLPANVKMRQQATYTQYVYIIEFYQHARVCNISSFALLAWFFIQVYAVCICCMYVYIFRVMCILFL